MVQFLKYPEDNTPLRVDIFSEGSVQYEKTVSIIANIFVFF